MLSTRAKREKIIEIVDKSVREKFPFGSNNRPEDVFNSEKINQAIDIINKFATELKGEVPTTSLDKFLDGLKASRRLQAGNCDLQAFWVMGELIRMDVYPVHLIKIHKNAKLTHFAIALGSDPSKDPDNAYIYDPHGCEPLYPYKEFALGGHHANRYGDSISVTLSKTTAFDDATMCQWLGLEKVERIKFEEETAVNQEHKEVAQPLRDKNFWGKAADAHSKKGSEAFAKEQWQEALKEFKSALTILINLYGERAPQLYQVYYNIISTLYHTKDFLEAYSIIERFGQYTLIALHSSNEFFALDPNQCAMKLMYKSGIISLALGNKNDAQRTLMTSITFSQKAKNQAVAKKFRELAESALAELYERFPEMKPAQAARTGATR